jgi:hypothetical protein
MRVLFVMHYPGYLRYYDSTVRELAARGHTVELAFEKLGKQAEGLEALTGAPESISVRGQLKGRRDTWEPVLVELRRVTDYVRYLHPVFAQADYLRHRMDTTLGAPFRVLTRVGTQPARRVERLLRALLALEHLAPSSEAVEAWVRKSDPDVVVVTPLVTDASRETDVVKAARALGVPTVLAVASWDHLTTKGMIRERVDRVLVWNETQRDEARDLHFYDPANVEVTGAQPFDKWFMRKPSTDRAEFCRRAGLPDDRPFVLFVGSTASISAPHAEVRFVRDWVERLRASADPAVREAGVLVRPHPFNTEAWRTADLAEIEGLAVFPRDGANPVDDADRAVYFDSLYHSGAVVGINTSAMIEAAIIGRPVLTVQSDAFDATQGGTLHFAYLTPSRGGFLRVARSLDEHAVQLAEALADPERSALETRDFVERFVRPRGIDREATPLVADAVERAAAAVSAPARTVVPWARAVRPLLWGTGALVIYTRPSRLAQLLRRVRAAVP